MSAMVKGRGERLASGSAYVGTRSRRKRAANDTNHAFVQAFADELRDILREERRRVA